MGRTWQRRHDQQRHHRLERPDQPPRLRRHLTLNGVNTYTGPTTINSGHLAFNNAASFGSGGDPIRLRWGWAGGTMTYTAAGATTLAKPIELGPSTNGLRLTSTGTLTLTGVISGTSLDPQTTSSRSPRSPAPARSSSGPRTPSPAMSACSPARSASSPTTTSARQPTGSPSATARRAPRSCASTPPASHRAADHAWRATPLIRTTGQDAVISGPISGGNQTLTLTKTGAGTLTLTGTHTFGATIQITAGTLHVNGTLSPRGESFGRSRHGDGARQQLCGTSGAAGPFTGSCA